jgi:4-hydroxybenzoyl-CoA thioesterase
MSSGVSFSTELRIRFADVDSVGIVFYPRYFEFLNGIVEDWLESLGCGFPTLIEQRRLILPTRRVEADYLRPSRMGERLDARLSVLELGRTSLQIAVELWSGEAVNWRCRAVLVLADADTGRPTAWPDDLRARLG